MSLEKPTPEQIAKLPKWAQEHIENLDRRAVIAERNLIEWKDTQTPSEFVISEYTFINGKGEFVDRFIQTNRLMIKSKGVEIEIINRAEAPGVDISWSATNRHISQVACVPTGFCQIQIVAKENMR